MNPLLQLIDCGQSYWLDNLRRDMLTSGELHKRVTEEGLRGITSNPATFHKAIVESQAYDAQIRHLVDEGSWYAEDYLQREISIPKLINWLKRKGRFAKAIHVGTLDALFIDLWRTLPKLLCKQKRRRRTSRQLIEEYEYSLEDALVA